jgi:methionyl-tRNA formyltransferase
MTADPRPSCVLLLRSGHPLNPMAERFCRQGFRVLATESDRSRSEAELAALKPDFVFSFLNERILKGALLEIENANFHPAPPEYPGRGGASIALFDGVATYGATAHRMVAAIDAGAILTVSRFAVLPDESCDSLYGRAELAALDLFHQVLGHVVRHRALPPPSGDAWTRKPITRAEFEQWLMLDPGQPETFRRKVEAARHPQFPGPFVTIHGYRFALSE